MILQVIALHLRDLGYETRFTPPDWHEVACRVELAAFGLINRPGAGRRCAVLTIVDAGLLVETLFPDSSTMLDLNEWDSTQKLEAILAEHFACKDDGPQGLYRCYSTVRQTYCRRGDRTPTTRTPWPTPNPQPPESPSPSPPPKTTKAGSPE